MTVNFLEANKNFLEYTLGDALETAGIGMGTVIGVLALIAVCVIIISKVIRVAESKNMKNEAPASAEEKSAPVAAASNIPNVSNGSVELVDVDEKSAAVIMAIVSNESGIPLNRLAFKSIKLMED